MKISNVFYFGEDNRFHYGDVLVADGCFERIDDKQPPLNTECDFMIPGLVDIHVHGSGGADYSDGGYDSLLTMTRYLARAGTTSFCPAAMALPENVMAAALHSAVTLRDAAPRGSAAIRGVTLEGPFLSAEKKGAQQAAYLQIPDVSLFKRLQKEAAGLISIVCVAPELKGADDFIRQITASGVTVAAAHTTASYDEAVAGIDAGITHLTHLFNAMPPLLHREPSVIGAASERDNVTAELICDGVHLHPAAVRAAFKLFGASRLCLISDAMAACGLEDGEYMLGGQKTCVSGGRVTLADGTIAGSTVTLFDCMRTAIAMGIQAEDAVRCATVNPAKRIGANNIGCIAEGKRADFLICGRGWTLKDVYMDGRCIGSV